MGLDNGIVIRGVTRKQLPLLMRYHNDKDYIANEVEICYWRKCWGLRNAIIHTLFITEDPEKYEYKLTIKDVDFIRALLVNYLKHPEDWDDSIWTFDEIKHSLYDYRWNLILLHFWMKRHPDKEVIFYDSY